MLDVICGADINAIPTQTQRTVLIQIRPDKTSASSRSKLIDTLMVFLRKKNEKVDFDNRQKHVKLPSRQRVINDALPANTSTFIWFKTGN